MAAVKGNLVVLRLYGHTRGACGSPESQDHKGGSVPNVIARHILKLPGRVKSYLRGDGRQRGGGSVVYEWFWNTSALGRKRRQGEHAGPKQGPVSKLSVGYIQRQGRRKCVLGTDAREDRKME